jgi:hypothetical protein
MTTTRSLVISISWALLSAAPLLCALDAKPSEARMSLQLPVAIQELELQSQRFVNFPLQVSSVSVSSTEAQDFSRYREFRLGTSLSAVVKQADVEPSEARMIHKRPAVVQELEWRPQGLLSSTPQVDPVSEVLFSFYNGELFRMVVNYSRQKTEGLTDEDMVEAISAKYGTATRPEAKILFSSFQVYNDNEKVIARWEDPQYSFDLFRSSYQPTFGMLVLSKQLDGLARAAIVEAIRLDEQEAPQREIQRQKQEDEANRVEQDAARLVNKAAFRP